MHKRFLAITAALLILSTSAWAQLLNSPWPKIHKNVKNSGYTSNVGTSIGKIKWKFSTEKPVTSSPALDDSGKIYFGSADKHVYCLDRTTGSLIWSYETGDAIEDSSPAIDSNHILYIGSNDGNLYAFDTVNINLANPQPLWTYPTAGGITGSPNIAQDGTIIFGSTDGFVYALHPTNPPTLKWRSTNLGILWSTPTIDYVYSTPPVVIIGSTEYSEYQGLETAPVSVFVHCLRVFSKTARVKSTVYVLDLATGTYLFDGLRLPSAAGTAVYGAVGISGGGNYVMPFEGSVYVGSLDNYIKTAIDYPSDNNCIDVPNPLATQAPGSGNVYGTPAILPESSFYIGQGATLYRIYPSLSTYFSYATAGQIETSAAVDGNFNAYVGCNGGVFYCINSNSPAQPLRWRYPETGNLVKLNGDAAEIISSPAIDNDAKHSIYFGASDGAMYAFYDGASIKGKVTTDGTTPLAAVVITLKDSDGNVVATTSTNTAGTFEFFGITSGQYTVIPTKYGLIFDPSEAPVTLTNLDAYVDFIAATAFTITGRVLTGVTGLPNVSVGLVTINASGAVVYSDNSIVTNALGYYTFTNIGFGTSVITPILPGWGFAPPSITQAIPVGTAGGQTYTLANFQGTLGYQISGTVKALSGTGIGNVTVTVSGTSITPINVTTAPDGTYSITGLSNGSYKVTPTLAGYIFNPQNRTAVISNASQLNQDFVGTTGGGFGGLLNSPWPKIHKDVKNSGYTTAVGTAIGKIKWKFLTEKPIASSPVLDNNNRIYFGSDDSNLYCLDRTTGGLIWKYHTNGAFFSSSPAIDINSILYIGSSDSNLYAFDTINIDTQNPQPLWIFPTLDGVQGSPTIADDGTIIFGSSDGFLYALNPTNPPSVKWQANLGIMWATPTIDYEYPPVLNPWYTSAPIVLMGSTQYSGQIGLKDAPEGARCEKEYDKAVRVGSSFYALDLEFGTVMAYGLRSGKLTGNALYGSIGIQPGGNYIFPFEGLGVGVGWIGHASVYSLDNSSCTLVPDTEFSIQYAPTPARVKATPTVNPDGFFYIGQGSSLFRIDPSLSSYFEYPTEGLIESSVALDQDGNAYFGCNGGVFYCINSSSQAQPMRWRFPETGNLVKLNGDAAEITSSPAIDNDDKHSIYFGATDGAMYAFYDGASIKGKVTTDGTTPLAAVEIALKDSASKVIATTSTDTDGTFEFFGIGAGQYTVTPKKGGYIFNPAQAPVTLTNVDAYVEFIAGSAFTITGRVVAANSGAGMPNVSIGLITRDSSQVIVYSDNSTVTDADGYYTISNIGYGTTVVTPYLQGWGFNPPSITQPIPVGTTGGQTYTLSNFEGTLGYQISGKVIDPSITDPTQENGIANVVITLAGDPTTFTTQQITTNSQGTYSFTGLPNGTYTITPSLGVYKFSPQTRSVVIKNSSSINQDFYGAVGLVISGFIKISSSDNSSLDTFTVNLYRDDETFWSKIFNKNKPRTLVSTANVASNGFFIFMGVAPGKYIVEPSGAGFGFEPASTKVTVTITDVANLVFQASVGFTISGSLTNLLGGGQSGINVILTNSTGDVVTTTTKLDGSYTFTGLVPGTYTVTPELSDTYSVSPASRSVTIVAENQRKINFLVISYCSKTIITLPFWGADGDGVTIIGTNFGPPPTDNTTAVAITLSDGTTASFPAGVYFGTNDPASWVAAKVKNWSPFYINAKVPLLNDRLVKVWVVRGGLKTCIKIVPTNFFINTR